MMKVHKCFRMKKEHKICWLMSLMFAWPRYLPRALPAVPIFKILISPKYEPALSDAITVLPLSPTTCKRPRFTMYISLPTSPIQHVHDIKCNMSSSAITSYLPFRHIKSPGEKSTGLNLNTSSHKKPASVFWKISTRLSVSKWTFIAISACNVNETEWGRR